MTPQILKISATINDFLWGPYMLGIFLFTGLLFTVGTGFFQFRHIRLWLRYTFFSLFKKREKRKRKYNTATVPFHCSCGNCRNRKHNRRCNRACNWWTRRHFLDVGVCFFRYDDSICRKRACNSIPKA